MTGAPDDRLQRYFDGELDAEEASAVSSALDEDAELRAKLSGLAHLHTMVVAAADEQAADLDSGALFDRIQARLAAPAADERPAEDERSAVRDEPEAAPARRPLGVITGGRTKEADRPRRKNVVWMGVGATLAAAAAVLLFVVRPFGGGESVPPPGSEVVEVDFGYSTGAIFSVEGQAGERYAVVWISDEKPESPESTQ